MEHLGRPRYIRQRLLLALIAAHPDGLTATEIQKKMFLLMRQLPQDERLPYSFFPYKYGCYSLLCDNDRKTLVNGRWLREEKREDAVHWRAAAVREIPDKWAVALNAFMRSAAGRMSSQELVRHVYKHHPFYAINRDELGKVLRSKVDRERVRRARPSVPGRAFFTIGYEGRSFEEYVRILLENGVKILIDVRANPISRKPGFSKVTLRSILPNAKIAYQHLPELGIAGYLRRDLSDATSRRRLFDKYRASLSRLSSALEQVYDLWVRHERVALTCFEAAASDCHRKCISEKMQARFADIRADHL